MQSASAQQGYDGTQSVNRILIALSLRSYRFLWIMLVVLHAGHSVAFGIEAAVFLSAMVNGSELNEGLQAYRLGGTFNVSVSASMLISSSCVCLWHSAAVLRALFWSVRQNRLAFTCSSLSEADRAASNRLSSQVSRAVMSLVRQVYAAWLSVFGLDSNYFDNVRDVRELVEIGSQTYMVYFTSKSIASHGLTSFGAVALAFNCWSTPLIDVVWRHDESRARYFRLLIGILLACCFTIAIRAIEFDEYVREYVLVRWYSIEWTVNSLSQLLHMIINTWLELAMNRANLLSMTLAMETLKSRVQHPCEMVMIQEHVRTKTSMVAPIVPVSNIHSPHDNDVVVAHIVANPSARRRRVLFYVYGVAILGIHVSSSLRSPFVVPRDGAICHVEVRPWLQKYASCLALELNCYRLGIQGSAAEIDTELKNVNKVELKALIFSHCPRLEMPPLIQELERLFGLEVYNSTIVRWNEDAALSTDFHPSLVVLRLILVQGIAELPPGLVAPKFPANDIELVLTDLASLPDDLETRWPHEIAVLGIQGSRLDRVPDFVTKAKISRLFLGSNSIQVVPTSLFANHSYELLMLSGNPIRELPSSLLSSQSPVAAPAVERDNGNGTFQCQLLLIQATQISEIPKWTLADTSTILAGSSPFCLLSQIPSCNASGHSVDCTPSPDTTTPMFPLALYTQLRLP